VVGGFFHQVLERDMSQPRSTRTQPLAALLVILGVAACADGTIALDERIPSGRAYLSGEGELCASSQDCQADLRCLRQNTGAICVAPCANGASCASGVCNPVANSATGWCSITGGAPIGDDDLHSPPGGGPAPEPPEDEEPTPDPDPEDGWVDDGDQGGDGGGDQGGGATPAPPPENPPAPDPIEEDDDDPGLPPPPIGDDGGGDQGGGGSSEPEPEPCSYPRAGSSVTYNQTMPDLSWDTAYTASGSTSFSMEAFHCDPDYDSYGTVVFVIGTEWCPNCPQYERDVAAQATTLRNQGMLVVFAQVQDNNYNYPSSQDANRGLGRHVGSSPSLRIGDGETSPAPGTLYSFASSFPTAFVVRRSDMKVIADMDHAGWSGLDLSSLAQQNPPQGNSGGGGNDDQGGPPPDVGGDDQGGQNFPPSGGCSEESYEPNDGPNNAPHLSEGSFSGGVCDGYPDFYFIPATGQWQLDLDFSHADGDLDVYVWDPFQNQPASNGQGGYIGSDGQGDGESFTHSGPSVVMVYGYQGATAAYNLSLTVY
jgi:hypothetical protein